MSSAEEQSPFKNNPNYNGISDCSSEGHWVIRVIEAAQQNQQEVKGLKRRLDVMESQLLEMRETAAEQEVDPLTGVPSRLMFEKHLNSIEKDGLKDNHVAIIFLDLDNLKTVNDTYGHVAGDAQLVTASAYFMRNIRRDRGDIVARIGGDEFAVICVNTEDSDDFDSGISDMIEERLIGNLPPSLKLEFSFGYAIFDSAIDTSLRDTLHRADLRMYEHKKSKTGPSFGPEYYI